MITGLRTAIYPVADLAKAKEWYTQAFGKAPYFDQPFYVGFEIGGFELGLVPDGESGTQGCTAYWGAEDIDAEVARLAQLGATLKSGIQDVGEGIRVAEMVEPFGNLIGLIFNPHFDAKAVK